MTSHSSRRRSRSRSRSRSAAGSEHPIDRHRRLSVSRKARVEGKSVGPGVTPKESCCNVWVIVGSLIAIIAAVVIIYFVFFNKTNTTERNARLQTERESITPGRDTTPEPRPMPNRLDTNPDGPERTPYTPGRTEVNPGRPQVTPDRETPGRDGTERTDERDEEPAPPARPEVKESSWLSAKTWAILAALVTPCIWYYFSQPKEDPSLPEDSEEPVDEPEPVACQGSWSDKHYGSDGDNNCGTFNIEVHPQNGGAKCPSEPIECRVKPEEAPVKPKPEPPVSGSDNCESGYCNWKNISFSDLTTDQKNNGWFTGPTCDNYVMTHEGGSGPENVAGHGYKCCNTAENGAQCYQDPATKFKYVNGAKVQIPESQKQNWTKGSDGKLQYDCTKGFNNKLCPIQ